MPFMTQNEHDPNAVDWQGIRQSLARDHLGQQENLLQQRAQQYARPLQSDQSTDRALDVLVFQVGGEAYAIDVTVVRAIRTLPPLTPVPGTPPFYLGVVNIRGQILTVLDLRSFFGLASSTSHLSGELVTVQANGLEIGLLADHVRGVETYAAEAFANIDQSLYIRGVTSDRLALLDIGALFTDKRLILGTTEE
jgi:purine-binding chemotaxis protein CheW